MSFRWHCAKWACLIVSVLSILLAAFFLWRGSMMLMQQQEVAVGDTTASRTNIEKPLIVERVADKIVWRLRAESAAQQDSGMHLEQPQLELFTGEGEAIMIRSKTAIFDPVRRNIVFRQEVTAEFEGWVLNTELLRYLSRENVVVVPGVFDAAGPDAQVRGRGLRANQESQQLSIAHNVWVRDLRREDNLAVKTK